MRRAPSAAEETQEHDLGLSHDLPRMVTRSLGRRGVLGILGGLGVATVAGCGETASTGAGRAGTSSVTVAAGEIPEETAGPFPADGSNGPNVLTESGVVRRDLTSSFGDASGVAEGVPRAVRLRVYDLAGEEATPLAGAAVYLWHCDRDGNYSMYSEAAAAENYLRGVQQADTDGRLEFHTIFPGCYPGRWPHLHFEVYRSLLRSSAAGLVG